MSYDFLKQATDKKSKPSKGTYKVLIADDDPEVHTITKIVLRDFEFQERRLEFFHTYSGAETLQVMTDHPDMAMVFLDVVMEENNAGLKVVEAIRGTLNNQAVRIVLRTGQPGEAPEETVLRDYDINDYRLKTDITVSRLYTIMYTALRGYQDIKRLENHKMGLEKIIETSANIFKGDSYSAFLSSVLSELSRFYEPGTEMIYAREVCGLVALEHNDVLTIVAATGKYERHVGVCLNAIDEISEPLKMLEKAVDATHINVSNQWYLVRNPGSNAVRNLILIEDPHRVFDVELIRLFLTNYSVALDNYILNNAIYETQREIIHMLGEVVEKHFDETSKHVNRMAEMMAAFAKEVGYTHIESEMIKVASTLHDVGKIGIPDAILKKPGKLTLEEFKVIQTHPKIGHKILSRSELEIIKMAAQIALYHHEKFDGSGYPEGLSGKAIPELARMLAILDVFDAMTHKRVYKDAASDEEALDYLRSQKGKHFDPELVEVFLAKVYRPEF